MSHHPTSPDFWDLSARSHDDSSAATDVSRSRPSAEGGDRRHTDPPHVVYRRVSEGEERVSRRSSVTSAVLTWLLAVLVVIIVLRFAAPYLAEEIQYSMTRGQQRAEFETASRHLQDTPLEGLSRAYQMVSQRVGPSVVSIDIMGSAPTPTNDAFSRLFGDEMHPSLGQGSGVVVDDEGFILTNYHVVRGAEEIRVTLSDGRRVRGQLIGYDAPTDLAVLKVNANKLIAAEWGDSEKLEVGGLVWAVGSPFGLERSITFGILSAKNRAGLAGTSYQDFLQTDAAVNPGNSGGPLVDTHGNVVGINTAIVGQAYQGVSFAIPSRVARDVYDRLRNEGRVVRGWVGVSLDEVSERRASELGLAEASGAYIVELVHEAELVSPAKTAGIEPGDVILQFNGQKVRGPATLSQLVARAEVGEEVEVVVFRGGEQITLQVPVAKRPNRFN